MNSSRSGLVGKARPGRTARLAVTAGALVLLGCASAQKPHPAATSTPAPASEAPPSSQPPSTPPPDEPEVTVLPDSNPRARDNAVRIDPTEEITPQELATIPDPVPGSAPRGTPQGDGAASSGGAGTSGGETSAGTASQGPWSVQIFASEDRGEAQRVARSAADRLQMPTRVDHEAPLYKVRIGRVADEQEAQSLRAQAIRAGYAGAFRVRTRAQ